MKCSPVINATVIGKMVEDQIGIRNLTIDFNEYRRMIGLAPIKKKTIIRYNNGGSGYDRTPKHYRQFLASYVGLI